MATGNGITRPSAVTPPRERCQSVASEDERQAAVKLIQAYRSAEKVSADNNIEVRQQELGRPFGAPKGVGAEMLKREIAQCDHNAFVAAAEELAKLRSDAVELIKPYLKQLVISLDDALNAAAAEAEKRIEAEGLPVIDGGAWTLHHDGLIRTLWFRRLKAQKALDEIWVGNAVGAVRTYDWRDGRPVLLVT